MKTSRSRPNRGPINHHPVIPAEAGIQRAQNRVAKTVTCPHCRYERPRRDPHCPLCGYPWPWLKRPKDASGQE